jgi:hypothetical protein
LEFAITSCGIKPIHHRSQAIPLGRPQYYFCDSSPASSCHFPSWDIENPDVSARNGQLIYSWEGLDECGSRSDIGGIV